MAAGRKAERTAARLRLMKEIERRNDERIKTFGDRRKGASKSGKRKTRKRP